MPEEGHVIVDNPTGLEALGPIKEGHVWVDNIDQIGGGGGGGPAETYEHIQAAASNEWVVNHGLGRYLAAVSAWDTGGTQMLAEVVHTTLNQVRLLFSISISGRAVVV